MDACASIGRLATREVRHFAAVRLRDGRSLSWWFIQRIPTLRDARQRTTAILEMSVRDRGIFEALHDSRVSG